MGAGHFLRSLFEETESKAKEAQDKFDKERQGDIDMYRKVLLDPNASPEQRTKAASEIEKLRNIKGKQGPFSNLANILNVVKGHHGKMKAPPQSEQLAGQSQPEQANSQQQMQPPPSSVGGAKQNVAQRAFDKVGKGLGVATGILDRAMTGKSGSGSSLPPLDSGAFNYPTVKQQAEQQHVNEMLQYKKDLHEASPGMTEEQLDHAVQVKFGALGKPGAFTKKSTVAGDSIPEGTTDAFGRPISKGAPYDVLENTQGERQYFPSIGKPDTYTSRITQQWVYNPQTQQFELKPIASESHTKHSYPSMKQPPNGSRPSGGMKPPPSIQKSPITQPSATTGHSSQQSKDKNTPSQVIPIRAFGPLQKQANAINEARNSLVGDKENETGGLAKDIDIFKNPASVKRVSEYIRFVNSQLEEQGRMATGSGPMAAAEWYVGLPGVISNLQSEAARNYSKTLDHGAEDGPERKFVNDYYRWLGTWGAMRAATGASAARWSFKTLISEGVTPGPVTTYPEAVRRVKNMAQESNVVSKHNPMVQKVNVDGLFQSESSPKLDDRTMKTLEKWGLGAGTRQ